MKFEEFRKNTKVLIVDDETPIHFMLKQFLRDIDELHFAKNGKEAIEVLENHKIHVVITDIRMPEFDGIELLKYIKEKQLPLKSIVITGHGEKDEAIECLRLGAFDFITKPFEKIELLTSLDRLIRESFLSFTNNFFQENLMKKNVQLRGVLDKLYLAKEDLTDAKQMAPGLAHEVRNPMMIILGKLDLLERELKRQDKIDEKLENHIGSLKSNSKKVNEILKSMLSFYQSDSKLAIGQFEVSRLIQEAKCTFEDYIEKDIEIIYEIEDGTVSADRIKMVQVIFNLLKNAYEEIKNTDGPWIKIKTEFLENELCFQVIDSGNGISPEVATKLFHEGGSTKEAGKGYGLGLMICKKIVDAHKGQIGIIEGSENTTFQFCIPIQKSI